jgi:hypothetical protein
VSLDEYGCDTAGMIEQKYCIVGLQHADIGGVFGVWEMAASRLSWLIPRMMATGGSPPYSIINHGNEVR